MQLTTCLLHELRLARASEWYGWLQALPRETIEIPTLWADPDLGGEDGKHALGWLAGTETESELSKKHNDGLSLVCQLHWQDKFEAVHGAETSQADLREYHASLDLPPTYEHPDRPSFASFLYAYSLVSTRGFIIDAYHSVGLIPFCDMFNHSSTSPHTSLSNDAGVCDICGSLLRCSHDSEDSERLEHLSQSYLNQLEREGMADKVDMRVQRSVKAGEEIMSCYDEDKSNAALLVEYGFIDDERNSRIKWVYRDVLTPETLPIFIHVQEQLGRPSNEADTQSRSGSGSSNGLIGAVIEDQHEPPQIRSSGEISPALFLALYPQSTASTNLEETAEEMLDAMSQIRSLRGDEGRDFSRRIKSTINSLVELLQRRLRGYHRNESSVVELEAELEVSTIPGRMVSELTSRRYRRDQNSSAWVYGLCFKNGSC